MLRTARRAWTLSAPRGGPAERTPVPTTRGGSRLDPENEPAGCWPGPVDPWHYRDRGHGPKDKAAGLPCYLGQGLSSSPGAPSCSPSSRGVDQRSVAITP